MVHSDPGRWKENKWKVVSVAKPEIPEPRTYYVVEIEKNAKGQGVFRRSHGLYGLTFSSYRDAQTKAEEMAKANPKTTFGVMGILSTATAEPYYVVNTTDGYNE